MSVFREGTNASRALVKPTERSLREEMGDSRTLIQDIDGLHAAEAVPERILRRYEFCQKLSRGAYGVVWKARDKQTRRFVALKKIFQAFRNAEDAQKVYREVMLLHEFRGHDNLVCLKELKGNLNSENIWLVFEYMETDLLSVIRANILADNHRKYIIYQILRVLKYLHSGGIIHRDIKPSNILLNKDCHVRLADLGCCRSVHNHGSENHPQQRSIFSEYIGTRWYRPPECILGAQRYGKPVDIWGVGCILGEMLSGKPLFPGTGTMDQLRCIITVTGRPTVEDIQSTGSPFAEIMMADVPQPTPQALSEMYPDASAESLDMIRMMLQFNPHRRVSVEQGLRHPYVVDFHNPEDEPTHHRIVKLPLSDNIRMSAEASRKHLFEDLRLYHIESKGRDYKMPVNWNST